MAYDAFLQNGNNPAVGVQDEDRIVVRVDEDSSVSVGVRDAIVVQTSCPIYDGATTATPTQGRQVFRTGGKKLLEDFTVEPIPSNYGLITYNGFELTVK